MSSVRPRRNISRQFVATGRVSWAIGPRHLLVPAAACSLLAGAPVASNANPVPIVAGSSGKVTLDQLAGGGITLPSDRQVESRSFQFRMPPGAKQGSDVWYTIHLDVSAAFMPGAGLGSVLVSGSTNGMAAAQVQFYAERDPNGQRITSWDSVDVFHGAGAGHVKGRHARVKYANVLQVSGVKPGLNTLTLEAETFGGAEVASIEIGSSSGVYATTAAPVNLKVDGELSENRLDVGETGDLAVEVSSGTSRTMRDVRVAVLPRSNHLFIDGPASRRIEKLDGSATTHFTVGRTRPGELKVSVIAASSSGSEASAFIEADIGKADDGLPWLLWLGLGIGALAVGSALLASRRKQGRAGR